MNEKNIVGFSFVWKFLERGVAQFISLAMQIVLARIVSPKEFGAIAIILVFINIANVFIQKGFSSSLIRKKSVTDEEYNTVFVASEGIAIVAILTLAILSSVIERFYEIKDLGVCLIMLSFSLPFGALYSIENACLVREMHFKKIFICSLISSLLSGIIGITMASLQWGIWALVWQAVSQQIFLCLTTLCVCEWKPKFCFSQTAFNEVFSFGSKILLAELLSITVEDIRTLLIGRKYSPSDLAYYDRGQVYPATLMRSIYDSISSVLLPVYAKEQENKKKLAKNVTLSIELAMFISVPMFVGLAAISKEFIYLILTPKWEKAIPFFVIFCFYQMIFPVYGILRQCLYAMDQSKSVLKLEVIKSFLFLSSIIIVINISPLAIAIATCFSMYLVVLIYALVVKKFLNLKLKEIFAKIIGIYFQSMIMYGCVMLVNNLKISNATSLLVKIIVGIVSYILLASVSKNRSYLFLKEYCISIQQNSKSV